MADMTARIIDAGPIEIDGVFEMLDGAGQPYRVRKRMSLCRCGQSKRAPFCDFSHEASGFDDACRAARFTAIAR